MSSENIYLDILKRVSSSKLAVVCFIIAALSLGFLIFGKASWHAYVFLGFETKYIIGLIFALAAIVVTWFVADSFQTKNAQFKELLDEFEPTDGQLEDVRMFLSEKRNIMNPKQLASEQLSAFKIIVVAPTPLEALSDDVLRSTVEWLKRHKDEPDAYIEYWSTDSFGDSPPVTAILPRIITDAGNPKVAERIRCVTVPNEILFIDFTIWVFPDGKIRAFANDRDKSGKQYRLWELHGNTAYSIAKMIASIRGKGTDSTIDLTLPDRDATKISINRKVVTHVPHEILDKLKAETES